MPFWSGETLETRLPALVSGFDKDRIDCNAYELRMGREYFCTSDGKRPIWRRAKKSVLAADEMFVIPAGQFAFLETKEEIEVPRDAMAFISLKSGVKWEGIINVSGFHVDPGYKGKLVFSIYNAGPAAVVLQESMPLFLIWYAALDISNSQKIKGPNAAKAISRDLVKKMSNEILSLQSLSKEISRLRIEMRIQTIIFAFGALLFGGIITGVTVYILEHGLQTASSANAPTQGALATDAAGQNSGDSTKGGTISKTPTTPPTQPTGNITPGTSPAKAGQSQAHGTPGTAKPAGK